jgi:hypothetical protein
MIGLGTFCPLKIEMGSMGLSVCNIDKPANLRPCFGQKHMVNFFVFTGFATLSVHIAP